MSDASNVFGRSVRDSSGGHSPEDFARFPLNDIGNAMRLILLAGGDVDLDGYVDATDCRLLFVLGLGWFGFNGQFWDSKFGEDLARKLAHQVAHKLPSLQAVFVAKGIPIKEVIGFERDTGSAGKTSAMLTQARSYLTVELEAFDADIFAINCRNGTLKVAYKDGQFTRRLCPHDPSDRITRCAAVDYDAKAKAPEFCGVLNKALADKEERGYFHRTLGYCSTGSAREQAFFLIQGPGQDSKSTLLDACREALGTYGVAASPDTFLEQANANGSGPQPDLIKLSGDTRLAILSEPKRGAKMNEGLLKSWTSGSPISARDLNAKPINFRPRAKLIFECNSFPVAKGDDDGIWRRIKPILFRRKVKNDEVDRDLPDRMRANELPGILNWLVDGIGDWFERGLDPPATMKALVDDYRKSSSPFGDWLTDCCVSREEAPGCRELTGTLYASFKDWCEEQGNDRVMSAKAFGDALRDRQIIVAGKNAKGLKYRGPIRLKTHAEMAAGRDAEPSSSSAGGMSPPEMGSSASIFEPDAAEEWEP